MGKIIQTNHNLYFSLNVSEKKGYDKSGGRHTDVSNSHHIFPFIFASLKWSLTFYYGINFISCLRSCFVVKRI